MNEILFFTQALLIIGFAIGALKLGKSALVTWISVQALIANLFVLKQITLFGFHVTASDSFVIGSLLGLNFLQEYFSQDDAKKATWICFFFMAFFAIVSQLHLFYQPSVHDTTQSSYVAILSQSPRIIFASMLVFFLVQQIDIRFFAFLKNTFPQLSFSTRTTISLVFSQFLDTVLFSFVGMYGLVASVTDVILISFAVKLVVIFCFSSCMRLAKA
jgi:uncharacterized integral membrane protein (TIGR00697 family)